MIKCTECGYENMDGLDYCDGCGAKLNSAAASALAGSAATPPPPPPRPAAAVAPQQAAAPAVVSVNAAEEPASQGDSTPTAPSTDQVEPSAPAESTPAETYKAEAAAESASSASPPSEASTGEFKPEPATPPPAAASAATQTSAPVAAPLVSAATFKAKFVVVRGGRKSQEFPLEEGNNLIGRWDPETGSFPEVDLDADDPEAKISRKHALVRIETGKITVEDIGSLNGTYVNRQPRLQPGNPTDIKNGDEIIIGKTFLKLVVDPVS